MLQQLIPLFILAGIFGLYGLKQAWLYYIDRENNID